MMDISRVAAGLRWCGWKSEEAANIKAAYLLTDEETEAICKQLKRLENATVIDKEVSP